MANAVDPKRLEEFMHHAVADLGAAASAALVLIGDRLGLYRELERGPATPLELSRRTSTSERYLREWLANQAAGGYVSYDAASGSYSLSPEQAIALAQEDSPAFLPGAFQILEAMWHAEPRIRENFRTGDGLPWTEQDHSLFEGTERFFRPGYAAHLEKEWIPALQGVEEKLRAGAKVADVGCGHGASTVIMAKAFPRSTFIGYDFHPESIETARKRAVTAKVGGRVRFEVAAATDFPGSGYDLVTHFDCLHDLPDPVAAGIRAREALSREGTWMIVEPFAGDSVAENLNPVGRLFYAASTMVCVPNSLAFHGVALGAQAGETRIGAVVQEAGFGHFRRATQTPFNLVFEARA
jgi:2-polyprenyl-3-methyl-5-hydroxy-6-metoxy-1,4-benzoquinol methylase